jgi:hypothetical protein
VEREENHHGSQIQIIIDNGSGSSIGCGRHDNDSGGRSGCSYITNADDGRYNDDGRSCCGIITAGRDDGRYDDVDGGGIGHLCVAGDRRRGFRDVFPSR